MYKSLVIAALLLAFGSLPVSAQDFARSIEVAQRGLTADVLKVLRPLAEQEGSAIADRPAAARAAAASLRRYRQAAERGDPAAQNRLGLIYGKGLGVPQDFVTAHMWFTLASSQDLVEASIYRDLVAKQMSPPEIARSRQLARSWRKTHNQLISQVGQPPARPPSRGAAPASS